MQNEQDSDISSSGSPTAEDEISSSIESLFRQVSETPYNYTTHVEYIEALRTSCQYQELTRARENMHRIFPLSEDIWLQWIEDEARIASNPEQIRKVGDLYAQAIQDYFSINLWKGYTQYLVEQYNDFLENYSGEQFITLEDVRAIFHQAIKETGFCLPQSHIIWDPYRDFEEGLLEKSPSSLEQQERVKDLYQERLQVPHETLEKTWEDYSHFVTRYYNANYEKHMISIKDQYYEAHRQCQEREPYEQALVQSANGLPEFLRYIKFERKKKRPLFRAITTLFERALVLHYLNDSLWEDYIGFLLEHKNQGELVIKVVERSVRNCPWSGALWGHYFRILDREGSSRDDLTLILNRALTTELLNERLDDLVKVLLAYCDYERLRINWRKEIIDEEKAIDLIAALEYGLEKINQVSSTGDPLRRLEKYYIEIETKLKNIKKAREIWEGILKKDYLLSEAWISYAQWEISIDNIEQARSIFKRGSQSKTDWPERVFQAWENLEHYYGDLNSIQNALLFIRKQAINVASRREKAALYEAQNSLHSWTTEPQDLLEPLRDSLKRKLEFSNDNEESHPPKRSKGIQGDNMDIVEESLEKSQEDKKSFTRIRRDREHSTVAAANLPQNVTEGQLKQLFHQCGKIHSIRIIPESGKEECTAYIEFIENSSVLMALTKDKKRIEDKEISVYHPAETTLFVTNYPPNMEKTAFKEIFGQHGEIMDIRFPNKSVKGVNRRRFCYIEYKEQDSAHAALVEDGRLLETGEKLIVKISDPSQRKPRAPPSKNEIFIRNLPGQVNSDELRNFFETFGPIKDVRVSLFPDGKCKGTAFVEFFREEDAQASIALNSAEFKGNFINVKINDPYYNKTISKDKQPSQQAKNRELPPSVRVEDLPKDVTEEMLNELFSLGTKSGKVHQIKLHPKRHRAQIDFLDKEDPANAELRFDKYEWHGTTLAVKQINDSSSRLLDNTLSLSQPRATITSLVPSVIKRGTISKRGRKRIGVTNPSSLAEQPSTSFKDISVGNDNQIDAVEMLCDK
ncbi:hypothetical protein G9A89_012203 [Geosiphon pyriformis]|nr:hypothetical protein G9A89_012203 [Geosiphon pyriformis]